MKHKRLLINWLQNFIEVICELSEHDFRLHVYSGQSTLFVPDDILLILKRRSIIESTAMPNDYFFTFTNDSGAVVVKVAADPLLKNGLVLK